MGIMDNAKSVVNLAQEVGKMDLYRQAVELMAQVTEQQEKIRSLTDDLAACHERLRLRDVLTFHENAYYTIPPTTADHDPITDGPFCTRCADVNHQLVRLHAVRNPNQPTVQLYKCPECDNATGKPPRISMNELRERNKKRTS